MYVCICNEVTDREIKNATYKGASSMEDLQSTLNIGSGCGQCCDCAKGLLKEYMSSTVNMQPHTI